ncbi:MAG: hypothetical protein JWO75_739 [Actinomycetia bacterium]|nr:hypothetical protein [Actinomycetes bacterium]
MPDGRRVPLRTPHDSSHTPSAVPPGGGPAVPTGSAIAAQHPLPATGARLTGGLLHEWQRRNATASMPLALHQLVVAGNLDNLQLAIRAAAEPATPGTQAAARPGPGASGVTPPADLGYHGPVFMDSDIYKTLEAIGWELESARTRESPEGHAPPTDHAPQSDQAPALSSAFGAFAATTIELLARVQWPDGYLNSYVLASGEPRYQNLAASHEMYCDGHFFQAAIALARGTGDQDAMDIAIRLADHLVKEFAGQGRGLDGHPIAETALVELYRETGTTAYRDLAAQFVGQRGHGLAGDSGFGRRYLQDHLPVRERTTEVGHAVRALYLEAGVTDVATETNDTKLLNGSITRWADMVATKTSLTGGNGSRHEGESFGDRFELPPDRAYNETCAAIASFQWSWRLLLATGEAKYADHMERVLYNGFAAAISTDGMRFFYVNPLQRRVDHYEKDDPGRRREWFKCACCPPNIMRLLASLHLYLATGNDDTLTVHQYATATLTGADLSVEVETDYPWDGLVTLRVTAAPREAREIALRVPAWSAGAGLALDDQDESAERVRVPPDRYLRLRRAWRPGDEVRLRLDLTPRLTYPDRRVDALRGCVAIERGPLVYCLEQTDQPARLDELTALPGPPLTERAVTLPGIGATIQVTVPGRHASPGPAAPLATATAPAAAPVPPGPDDRAVTVTAIPYFQWDNRGPGAMRVWIPAGPPL